jgi:hypothetical protein
VTAFPRYAAAATPRRHKSAFRPPRRWPHTRRTLNESRIRAATCHFHPQHMRQGRASEKALLDISYSNTEARAKAQARSFNGQSQHATGCCPDRAASDDISIFSGPPNIPADAGQSASAAKGGVISGPVSSATPAGRAKPPRSPLTVIRRAVGRASPSPLCSAGNCVSGQTRSPEALPERR